MTKPKRAFFRRHCLNISHEHFLGDSVPLWLDLPYSASSKSEEGVVFDAAK